MLQYDSYLLRQEVTHLIKFSKKKTILKLKTFLAPRRTGIQGPVAGQ